MTRNLKLFIGATIIFYFIGGVNDARAMYVLAGASLAVILGCYVLSRLAVSGLDLQVSLSRRRGTAGTRIPVKLQLANLRGVTRPTPTVTLEIANATVAGVDRPYRYVLPNLDGRATQEIDVTVDCPARGRYRINHLAVEGTDPIGMFRRPRRFPAHEDFVALPKVFSAPGIAAWELLSPEGRRVARGRRRDAGDFGGIREYAPGDDLRYVHWKATAHTGRLAIKEFEQRQEAQIAVWLDLSAAGVVGKGVGASTEIAVSVAASLLQTFIMADYTVQLIGEGLSPSLGLASRGEAYLSRALQALADVQAGGASPFSAMVMEQVRSAGRAHAIFVITTGAGGGVPDALAFCGVHGILPTVFVIDPAGANDVAEPVAARCRSIGLQTVVVTEMDGIATALRQAASLTEGQLVV